MQTDVTNFGYIHVPSLDHAVIAAILRNADYPEHNSKAGNYFSINLTSNWVRVANIFLEGIRNGQNLSSLLGYQFERR